MKVGSKGRILCTVQYLLICYSDFSADEMYRENLGVFLLTKYKY